MGDSSSSSESRKRPSVNGKCSSGGGCCGDLENRNGISDSVASASDQRKRISDNSECWSNDCCGDSVNGNSICDPTSSGSQKRSCDDGACSSGGSCEDVGNGNDNDLAENDAVHTARVMNAFLYYKRWGREKLCRHIASISKISKIHKDLLLTNHTNHMRKALQCVDENQRVLSELIAYSADMFGEGNSVNGFLPNGAQPAPLFYMGKVQSTVRQIVREWSEQGKAERDATFKPIFEELDRLFPKDSAKREEIRCFVPGAGLGRLAWELVLAGFTVQANEYSMFMLLASCYLLNKGLKPNSQTIYPFVFESTNSWSYEDQTRPVTFPDIDPLEISQRKNSFSMCAGNFLEIAKNDSDRWNCVVTAWFIDTANNILDYIDVIYDILKSGGIWINMGPLTYHFTDMDDEVSIELPYDEVIRLVKEKGFRVETEKKLDSPYTVNENSMLKYSYSCAFFTAVKE